MQQTVAVSSVPVQTGQVMVTSPPQSTLNIPVLRGLAITQIVFGVFTIIFGIVGIAVMAQGYWVNQSGSGIWFGIWILITGIIGVCSASQPQNRGLNGTNMGFNICCTIVSFFVGIFFAIALGFFNNCSYYKSFNYYNYSYSYYTYYYSYSYGSYYCVNKSTGIAIYSLLTLLMVAEFFVSLIISVYCCQGSGCCGNRSSGTVIVQQQPGYSVANTGHTVITTNTGYPQAPYPGSAIPYSGAQPMYQPYPQQSQPGMMVPQPGMMVQQPGMMVQQPGMMVQQPGMMVQQPGMMAAQTNTVYSADQQKQQMDSQKTAPPAYSS